MTEMAIALLVWMALVVALSRRGQAPKRAPLEDEQPGAWHWPARPAEED